MKLLTQIKNYLLVLLAGVGIGLLMYFKLSKGSKIDSELSGLQNDANGLKDDINGLNEKLDSLEVPDLSDQEVVDYWKKEL